MKRIILGFGAVMLVGALTTLENPATTELVDDYSTFQLWSMLGYSGKMLVAWFIGGLVAQRSFVWPAAFFSLIASAAAIWVMSRIVPDTSVVWLARESAGQFAAGVVVAISGAFLGQRYYASLRQWQ